MIKGLKVVLFWNFTTMPHSAGLTRCKVMLSMASVAVLATCAAQCRPWCQWMPGTQVLITNRVLSYLTNIMATGGKVIILYVVFINFLTLRTPQWNEEGILRGPLELWVVAPFTPEMSLGASLYCCKLESPLVDHRFDLFRMKTHLEVFHR